MEGEMNAKLEKVINEIKKLLERKVWGQVTIKIKEGQITILEKIENQKID